MLVCLAVVMFKSISVEENLIEISEIGIIKAFLSSINIVNLQLVLKICVCSDHWMSFKK